MRLTLVLILTAVACFAGAIAVPAHAADHHGCDLKPTGSVEQARVDATCYYGRRHARQLGKKYATGWAMNVPTNSCQPVNGNAFVTDCTFSVDFDTGMACTGAIRLRGNSTHPRAYGHRFRGWSCIG
jgi:hypothetical protein